MFKNVKKNKTRKTATSFSREKIRSLSAQTDNSGNGSQQEQFARMKPVFFVKSNDDKITE